MVSSLRHSLPQLAPRYHFWLYTDAGSYVFCEITQRFRESSLSVFQKRADCLRIAIPTGQVSSLRCSYCICPRSHPTCFIYLAVSQKSLSRDSMRAKLNITPRTSRKNQLAATSPQKTSRSKPCLLAGHAAATQILLPQQFQIFLSTFFSGYFLHCRADSPAHPALGAKIAPDALKK